jgi:hypothetical protein
MAKTIRKERELADILDDPETGLQIEAAHQRAYYEQCRREERIWERRKSGSAMPNP